MLPLPGHCCVRRLPVTLVCSVGALCFPGCQHEADRVRVQLQTQTPARRAFWKLGYRGSTIWPSASTVCQTDMLVTAVLCVYGSSRVRDSGEPAGAWER